MKKLLLGIAALCLLNCGSQVVEFPVDNSDNDSGVQTPVVDSGSDSGVLDPCFGVVCHQDQVCQNGECVCLDQNCPGGQVCSSPNGSCIVPDPCDGVKCPALAVCQDGACLPTDSCDGVICPEGKVCVDGACVCDGPPPPVCDGGTNVCDDGKTLICHYPPGNVGNKHDICVGDAAVPAHLKHGDKLGDCGE